MRYLFAWYSSTVNLFGGVVYQLSTRDSSTVYMYGGEIDRVLSVGDSSVASLFGGKIAADVAIFDSGMVKIYGYDFHWQRSGGGAESGMLSGYWLDGTAFSGMYLRNLPEPFPGSHIVLIPEPCTFLLLSLGSFILRRQNSSG